MEQVSISILFIAALLATIGRLTVRLRYQKRLSADDYILLTGCSSLITAFALTRIMLTGTSPDFNSSLMGLEPNDIDPTNTAPGFWITIRNYQQLSFSAEAMCWTTIFAVKISFLLFFRQLLDQLRALLKFWMVTVGTVTISGIFCICSIFISCPEFGIHSTKCTDPRGYARSLAISQLSNALDMLTDLLIVAVPILLLWKVKIRLRQKIILGAFLCLSICMFTICLIRTIGNIVSETEVLDYNQMSYLSGYTGVFNDQWNVYLQLTEASVVVFVVSLTAFRSLYGIKTLQRQENDKKRFQPWLSYYRNNLSKRRKQRRVDEFGDIISQAQYSLPSIPGATLTGIRSIFAGMTTKSTQAMSTRGDLATVDEAQNGEEPGAIRVTNTIEMHESVADHV